MGSFDGNNVGIFVGIFVGVFVGLFVGGKVGDFEGAMIGESVGAEVGENVFIHLIFTENVPGTVECVQSDKKMGGYKAFETWYKFPSFLPFIIHRIPSN